MIDEMGFYGDGDDESVAGRLVAKLLAYVINEMIVGNDPEALTPEELHRCLSDAGVAELDGVSLDVLNRVLDGWKAAKFAQKYSHWPCLIRDN